MAGLICSAAAIAGDNMQDLKCGHIVGATPWKQQVFQVVGVVSAAVVIPFILQILDAGQGIGRPIREGAVALSAPQAGLMRDLATGIFGAGINWKFIFMGFGLAVACIILDLVQARRGSSFRFPVLAVAVGIYLPLGLSVPIFAGGLLALLVQHKSKPLSPELRQMRANSGLLLASGLITGEALMGVLIAGAAVYFQDRMPGELPRAAYSGMLFTLAVIYYLYRRTMNSTADA
jgi:putative OPT family oligopeptide transporter